MWKYSKNIHKDTYNEANQAQAKGLLIYISPFQSPERSSRNLFAWSYVFVKCAEVRYFTTNVNKDHCLFSVRLASDTHPLI